MYKARRASLCQPLKREKGEKGEEEDDELEGPVALKLITFQACVIVVITRAGGVATGLCIRSYQWFDFA